MPAPVFCRGYDCPLFSQVKQVTDAVELRYYDASHWITYTDCTNHNTNGGGDFMKLFHYIGGYNDQGMRIPMTTPVVKQQVNEKCHSMSFFKPFAIDTKDLPKPIDDGIEIVSLPAQAFYVHSFGGYMSNDKFDRSMQAFDAAGVQIDDSSVFSARVAQYDAPFQLFNRHNEVWMPAEGEYIDELAMDTYFASEEAWTHGAPSLTPQEHTQGHSTHAHRPHHFGGHPPLWIHILHVAFTVLGLILLTSLVLCFVVKSVRCLQSKVCKKKSLQLDYLPVEQSNIDLVNAAFTMDSEKPQAEKKVKINAAGYTAL